MTFSSDQIVNNKLLTIFARIAIISATTIGLPICGWIGLRVISYADAINSQITAQNLQLNLLQQTVQNGLDRAKADKDTMQAELNDHEHRIRVLEGIRP